MRHSRCPEKPPAFSRLHMGRLADEHVVRGRVLVNRDAAQQQERLRLRQLIYGGLIVIGVYMVQPFLTAASLDLSARLCVIAFSVAIPLLTALVVVDRQAASRRRRIAAVVVAIVQLVAQWSSFVGVVAGFWHITWVAGVGVLAGVLLGTAVISVAYMRPPQTQLSQQPTPRGSEAPGDKGS